MNQKLYKNLTDIITHMIGTRYLQPAENCKKAHILNFIKRHNLPTTYEEVVGYFDLAMIGGGKKGIILTCKFVYVSPEGQITQPVFFDDIVSMKTVYKELIVTTKMNGEISFPLYGTYIYDLLTSINSLLEEEGKNNFLEEQRQKQAKAFLEQLEKEKFEKQEKERLAKEKLEKKEQEKLAVEKQAEAAYLEKERLVKEQLKAQRESRLANLSAEEKILYEKEIARKQLVKNKDKPTPTPVGVNGQDIEKQFIANPKASAFFCNALEVSIYNLSKAPALIDKENFTAKNKADIQRYFSNVNINDVVYFYDGYTVHKERQWAIVTPKEIIVSNGFRLSLTGIVSCSMSSDQSYLYVKYVDKEVSVYYKKFSTYIVQLIVNGTINAYNQLWNHAYNLEQQKKYQEAFPYHLEGAINSGNSNFMNSMGIYYFNGWYVKKNKEHAYEWYEKGSVTGNVYSMANLGLNYKNDKQYDKAWIHLNKVLKITSAPNRASALNTAGLMYRDGLGVDKNHYKALEYFKESSSKGNMYATYNLADYALYYDFDYKKGLEYILLAIKQNHKTAYKLLADCYQYGKCLPKNKKNAVYWYMEAKNKKCNSATFGIATQYLNQQKYDDAILEYQEAIENGNNYGYTCIAKVYLNPKYSGYNVDEALYYLEKGVHKGSPAAMVELAKMYLEGNGVIKDYLTALELLEQAKKENYETANAYLALMYLNGWGVNKNKQKAIEIFNKAIENHNTVATYEYAKVCLTHKDFNIHQGIEYLFSLNKRKGSTVYQEVQETLIDYLSRHPYTLSAEQKNELFDIFNELYEKNSTILDKKANLEHFTKTTIPVYAIKEEIDYKALKTKTLHEQFVTLLDIIAHNPKHYEACTALGKLYFSIGSYKDALYYHQIAYNIDAYKDDLDSLFQYYYLCVEVKHEYDKGKYLYQMIQDGYVGKDLFIRLVHKHREKVKMYEYSPAAIAYAVQNPTAYSKLIPGFKDTIIDYRKNLNASFSPASTILITSAFKNMKRLTNASDYRYKDIERNYREAFDEVYEIAKKGCIPAIKHYLTFGDNTHLYPSDYSRIANIYGLLNESITKEGMMKLFGYNKSSNDSKEIMNTLRNAVLFHDYRESLATYFTNTTEVDEAFYNFLEKEFANSRDIDTIAIMTRLTKKEAVSTLDIIETATIALTKYLNNEATITDIHQLNELYNAKHYDIVYASVAELAKHNNPEACYLLGKCYHYGHGVMQDIEQAEKYYIIASKGYVLLADIQLVHLAYDKVTTPKELETVYKLYKEKYYIADALACERALEIVDIFDYPLDESIIWKLKEYELGNLEAGRLAATQFLCRLCQSPKYVLYYFRELAEQADPLGLRVCAAACRLAIGCEWDTIQAHDYENQLHMLVTNGLENEYRNYGWMFSVTSSCKDQFLKETIVDYLRSIHQYSSKNVVIHKGNGDRNITILEKLEQHLKVKTYFKFKDGSFYPIHELGLVAFAPFVRGLFSSNNEVELIVIGDMHEEYWYNFKQIKENERLDMDFIKEDPLPTSETKKEDFAEQMKDCWALYDEGKYDEAYKKVLPLAKKGVVKAINMVGLLYSYGEGVPFDLDKAREWFQIGIDKKFYACYTNMGNIYYKYVSDETVGKKYAYHYYAQVIHKANAVVCKRALDILLSGLVDYNEDQKQKWINRLLELGEEEYVQSLNKES